MKNKNNRKIYMTAIILTFVTTFVLMNVFHDKSYSYNPDQDISQTVIPDGTSYTLSGKNMYSHFTIKNTGFRLNYNAYGTKKLSSSSGDAVVYCAEVGKGLGRTGRKLTRYSLSRSGLNATAQQQLYNMMQYAYPYITLSTLREEMKSYNNEYNVEFEKITAQEAITATQAVIWDIIKGRNGDYYITTGIISHQSTAGLNKFQGCSGYKNRILTTEEEKWLNDSGCDTNGLFYQNVVKTPSRGSSEEKVSINRINSLYKKLREISKKTPTSSEYESYSIGSKKFDCDETNTCKLTVTINTNVITYTATFKKTDGTVLKTFENTTDKTFVLENIPATEKNINVTLSSNRGKLNVFYYNSGNNKQDFIGAEKNTTYTTLQITKDPGKIIIYKVSGLKDQTGKSTDVNISYDYNEATDALCTANGAGGCLNDAKFAIYYSEINNSNFIQNLTPVYYESLVEENRNIKLTQSSSKYNFTTATLSNLSPGIYYIKEVRSPIGYDTYNYGVSPVDTNGFIKVEVKEGKTTSIIVNNEPSKICFRKVEKGNQSKLLEGATLNIYDTFDEAMYVSFNTEEKEYCIDTLQFGTYYLLEEKAPANYIKPNILYRFNYASKDDLINSNNSQEEENTIAPGYKIVDLQVKNNIVYIENVPGAYITKSDLATGECIEGAKLTIKDEKGEVKDSWTSNCDNAYQIKVNLTGDTSSDGLTPGKYTLTEEITPSGYATAESIEFTIDKNGKVDKSLDMKDAPIEACIKKVDKNGEYVTGAEFEIYDEFDNLVDKFTSTDAPYCKKYMAVGIYKVKETKAPSGYKALEDVVTINVIDTNKTQTFEIKNEVDVPKTSLDASKVITMIASVFIIFGIGSVGYYVYQKKH